MFNCKLTFALKAEKKDVDEDSAVELIEEFQSTLKNNGQIVGGYDIFIKDGIYCMTTVLPEEDSLSEKYRNGYVSDRAVKIEEVFDTGTEIEGRNAEYHNSCACQKPSWYFLYGDGSCAAESPVVCGDCRHPVPLYKLPCILGEKEHFSVLDWQSATEAMHALWQYGISDRFTYGQLSRQNSKLNRKGREICKELANILGVPVYLYVYYFDETDFDENVIVPRGLLNKALNSCPECGQLFTDDSEFVKCDRCGVLYDSPEWVKK